MPIQRELIDIKLELVDLLDEILEAHLGQVIEMNEQNLSKDNVIKVINK